LSQKNKPQIFHQNTVQAFWIYIRKTKTNLSWWKP